MPRIPEWFLVLPTLYLLNVSQSKFLKTSELIPLLRSVLNPDWEDLDILSWRKDDKFSQKVRNLKSHNTLKGYAIYDWKRKGFKLTKKWEKYLIDNQYIIEYILNNDFSWLDAKKGFKDLYKRSLVDKLEVELFDENIVIYEGLEKIRKVKVYERSLKLRDKAIQYFRDKKNLVSCECCSFNFDLFYWKNISKDYIEIHHRLPIYQYKWEDLSKTIGKALENLIPVCSNCHRMIHREKKTRSVSEIKDAVKKNWVF